VNSPKPGPHVPNGAGQDFTDGATCPPTSEWCLNSKPHKHGEGSINAGTACDKTCPCMQVHNSVRIARKGR